MQRIDDRKCKDKDALLLTTLLFEEPSVLKGRLLAHESERDI
jgi:hypothetical protein